MAEDGNATGEYGKRLRNWLMTIAYDGSGYGGWQRLLDGAGKKSIQGVIEEALSMLLKEDIKITGAGRTDAGVHALGQRANFHTRNTMNGETIKKELNRLLPEDIGIIKTELVPNRFHSRFGARIKTYEYHLENGERPCVFQRKYAAHVKEVCDIEKMRKASEIIIGTHDFKGFSAAMNEERKTTRTITDIRISKNGNHIVISVTGDGFLYHMVRLIAGTLAEVGTGRKTMEDVETILETRDRQLSCCLMPAKGLFLAEVNYKEYKSERF